MEEGVRPPFRAWLPPVAAAAGRSFRTLLGLAARVGQRPTRKRATRTVLRVFMVLLGQSGNLCASIDRPIRRSSEGPPWKGSIRRPGYRNAPPALQGRDGAT